MVRKELFRRFQLCHSCVKRQAVRSEVGSTLTNIVECIESLIFVSGNREIDPRVTVFDIPTAVQVFALGAIFVSVVAPLLIASDRQDRSSYIKISIAVSRLAFWMGAYVSHTRAIRSSSKTSRICTRPRGLTSVQLPEALFLAGWYMAFWRTCSPRPLWGCSVDEQLGKWLCLLL